MAMHWSQHVPVPGHREWIGNVLQQAFALPESGSFADLLDALDQGNAADLLDNSRSDEPREHR
jgi:hypothetical protein